MFIHLPSLSQSMLLDMFHVWDEPIRNQQPTRWWKYPFSKRYNMTQIYMYISTNASWPKKCQTILVLWPSHSNSCPQANLRTSNLDEWWVGCSDANNSFPLPVLGLNKENRKCKFVHIQMKIEPLALTISKAIWTRLLQSSLAMFRCSKPNKLPLH